MKTAVIYWTGTGNTEIMAKAVADGVQESGCDVDVFQVSELTADKAAEYDKLALGCPSMGAEVLEEGEFDPFFTDLESKLTDKKVALFGSYDWGDGEWMRDWEERTANAGALLCNGEGLIINLTPDDEGLELCKELGKSLAKA